MGAEGAAEAWGDGGLVAWIWTGEEGDVCPGEAAYAVCMFTTTTLPPCVVDVYF